MGFCSFLFQIFNFILFCFLYCSFNFVNSYIHLIDSYVNTNPNKVTTCNIIVVMTTYNIISNVVFCLAFFGGYIFISDKKSRQKALEIQSAFFHSLGNPKGRTLDHFFSASRIRHNFPFKLIPTSMISRNISEVINQNSTSALNYLDDFSLAHIALSCA